MCIQKIINSFGLILDIGGFILIWKYGLPNRIPSATQWMDTEDQELRKKYLKWSWRGFVLILIGFGLQILSNFI
jgi:hypothetical protein